VYKRQAYGQIKSGINNPALNLAFGNLLVIDTGSGASYGGGAGVAGTLESGADAAYTFNNIRDFQSFVGGGLWWLLAQPLFNPANGVNGINSITYIRAAATVAATISYTWTGGGAAGGSIVINPKAEGLAGNGVEDGGAHVAGFAARMVAGTIDTAKFVVEFYRGEFRGLDTASTTGILAGEAYDNVPSAEAGKVLLAKSIEFDNMQELIDWTTENADFNEHFAVSGTPVVTGAGTIDAADLAASAGNELAVGGTETFSTTHQNSAIDAIKSNNYDFILADDWGDDAYSTANIATLAYISTEAKVKPDLYVGGGLDATKFTQALGSVVSANSFNSQYATVVHGGIGLPVNRGAGFKEYQSIYHAAAALGREAGLAPQIPMTFKHVSIGKVMHSLSDNDVITGLNAGVLMTRLDNGSFEFVKGINTLQKNDFLMNDDGATHSKQLRRITRQINKELTVNIKNNLLKQEAGPNRNTVSTTDVEQYVKGYLQQKEAQDTADNLIIEYRDVAVVVNGDAYDVTYSFVPNFEVSFIFTTGFIIDPSV
jgi:hypothetical protein